MKDIFVTEIEKAIEDGRTITLSLDLDACNDFTSSFVPDDLSVNKNGYFISCGLDLYSFNGIPMYDEDEDVWFFELPTTGAVISITIWK